MGLNVNLDKKERKMLIKYVMSIIKNIVFWSRNFDLGNTKKILYTCVEFKIFL